MPLVSIVVPVYNAEKTIDRCISSVLNQTGLALQQIEGNLIYPRVVGSSVGLPSIWVGLGCVYGFWGQKYRKGPICQRGIGRTVPGNRGQIPGLCGNQGLCGKDI